MPVRGAFALPTAGGRGLGDICAPSLTGQVYEQLRESILNLQVPPGAPISELDVGERLGASRTPVHAAVSRLLQEGLLVRSHARTKPRLIVSPLTLDDMRELFLMTGALDGVAARLAAQLNESRRLALVGQLERINGDLRRLSKHAGPSPSLPS